jgi:hypothetical protein
MEKLLEGLSDLKPYQLRERANLLDMQIALFQAQVAEMREIKRQIREEQASRKGDADES